MLVLSRRRQERILLSGGIVVTVVDIRGGCVRLGFDAPEEVAIRRQEVSPKAEGGGRKGEGEAPAKAEGGGGKAEGKSQGGPVPCLP
jgi:carbon storage regulator